MAPPPMWHRAGPVRQNARRLCFSTQLGPRPEAPL